MEVCGSDQAEGIRADLFSFLFLFSDYYFFVNIYICMCVCTVHISFVASGIFLSCMGFCENLLKYIFKVRCPLLARTGSRDDFF